MFDTIAPMIIAVALTVLQHVIKNPASVKIEGKVIAEFAAAATQADMTVNGTVWNSTPAAPTPAPTKTA